MSVNGTGTHGEPIFGQVPQTRADLQAAADYARLVGNYIVGTSSGRTNATTAGLVWDGLEWYETDTDTTYRRVSGAWKPWNSGWKTWAANQGGATSAGGGTLQALYRYLAGDVEIEYTAVIANNANARVEVGGLPHPRGANGRAMPRGRAKLITPSGVGYPLNIDFNAEDTNSNTLIVRTATYPEQDTNGQSAPVNWNGCTFKMSFSYTPTI